MPYAKRKCRYDGVVFTPRARYDEACGPCRRAAPRLPAPAVSKTPARILFFDIETAGVNALKSDLGFCVNFGYKWNDEDEAHVLVSRKRDLRHFSDAWILEKASRLLTEADLTVGHFASVFDRRFFAGRLAINKLPSVPLTKMRDTCMIARAAFNFSSNRLSHLSEVLDLPVQKYKKKAGTEWPGWWLRVMQGDMTALKQMAEYCRVDVLTVEALYHRLLPFDNAHPRIVEDKDLCGACGGSVIYRGTTFVNGTRRQRFVCAACGRWGRRGA